MLAYLCVVPVDGVAVSWKEAFRGVVAMIGECSIPLLKFSAIVVFRYCLKWSGVACFLSRPLHSTLQQGLAI